MEVLNRESVILTIIWVYMMYFCSTSTPIYSEVLDKVHGLIGSGCREKYHGALQRSLHNFNTDHTHVATPEEGQALVNHLCDATESVIKDACEVVNPTASNSTRKTFWYRIWNCNGKPRSGHVYTTATNWINVHIEGPVARHLTPI